MGFDKSVLFVCLGNICRSPMAEGILRHLVANRPDSQDWKIDSCGTGNYHIGSQPHHRSIETLEENNITGFKHKARQLSSDDFSEFKWIFVFDRENLSDVKRKSSGGKSNIELLRVFDPERESDSPTVADPYFDGDEYFAVCYEQCTRSLKSFLEKHF